MTLTATQIRELLAAHGLAPNKALGQHFLADPNTAARIVRLADLDAGARVVEVGPGVGSLTVALLDASAHVCAIELDRYIVPVLEDVTSGRNVDIVVADALHVDWNAVLPGDEWHMVSNLPYNVATAVVVGALEHAPMIKRFLVMVQREVGERLAALPGTRAAGAVSVKVAWHATARIVGRVASTVFLPPPKVESALVELVRRPKPPVEVRDEARMFALVQAGFAVRRKTLRRALAGVIDADAFARAGIEPTARAESLTLDQWAALSDA